MKETLQIHHVAKRLPYGLKAEMLNYKTDYVGQRYDTLVGVHQWDNKSQYWSALTIHGSKPNLQDIKPILFPLSSLTETITIKGKSFVPIEVLKSNSETPYASSFRLEENNFVFDTQLMDSNYGAHKWEDVTFYCGNQLEMFEKLIEWHIDLPHENLIEKGLAISVFDLDKNPYE